MKLSRVYLPLSLLLAAFTFQAVSAESPFEKPMKLTGYNMKRVKEALGANKLDGVAAAATTMADELAKVRTFMPPINKARKAELPALADKSVAAARKLAAAKTVEEARASLQAVGESCKACHQIFQPEE